MRRSSVLLAGAAATTALVLGVSDSASATAVQVAYWRMSDTGTTMADSSGRGHTGTLHGVKVQQPGWSGGLGYGFLSTPSSVTVPSASDLNPGSSAFSVTVHVRFSQKPSASVGDYDLLRKGLSDTAGGDYKLEILGSGVAFCLFRGSGGEGTVTGTTNLATNTWHTITCARTASTVRLTVDGSTRSTAKSTGTISNTSTMVLGAKNGSGEDQYRGYLDSVTITKG